MIWVGYSHINNSTPLSGAQAPQQANPEKFRGTVFKLWQTQNLVLWWETRLSEIPSPHSSSRSRHFHRAAGPTPELWWTWVRDNLGCNLNICLSGHHGGMATPFMDKSGPFDHSVHWSCELNWGEGKLVRIIPNIYILLWVSRDKNMGMDWPWAALSYVGTPSVLGPFHTHSLYASWLKLLHFGWVHTFSRPLGAREHNTPVPLGTVLLGASASNPRSSVSPCACLSCFVYELLERGPFIFLLINSLLNNSWRYRPLIFCNLHHHTLTYTESWAFWSFCFRSILIFLWPFLEGSWDISF